MGCISLPGCKIIQTNQSPHIGIKGYLNLLLLQRLPPTALAYLLFSQVQPSCGLACTAMPYVRSLVNKRQCYFTCLVSAVVFDYHILHRVENLFSHQFGIGINKNQVIFSCFFACLILFLCGKLHVLDNIL